MTDFPPANLADSTDQALIRMCDVVRLTLMRHYDGELRARGGAFTASVFIEMLAMAIALELTRLDDDACIARLDDLWRALGTKIAIYQSKTEQFLLACADETGGQPVIPPSRLM